MSPICPLVVSFDCCQLFPSGWSFCSAAQPAHGWVTGHRVLSSGVVRQHTASLATAHLSCRCPSVSASFSFALSGRIGLVLRGCSAADVEFSQSHTRGHHRRE